ncbi:DUF2336 domain-containing protein [Gimibacter soli]|uniref:DUF2336 domain-containing protein n=1 Tax=Gimibacter soli TaxID=3024400 RepID=A0AAE9XRF2_9PROT|nr:DUF2336 domain-containing protein [Gimibacter soli]WCL54926.1 DUF2336 domain-containing protein [Gimibacter soli]
MGLFDRLKSLMGQDGGKGKAEAPAVLPPALTSEKEQQILKDGSLGERKALAARTDARPEVLYYLADDASPQVRQIIASNPSTPIHADEKLVADEDDEVRLELARKIARLVPGLAPGEQTAIRERAIDVLEALAADQLPKVRAIIADEIKTSPNVPKPMVDKLARDIEDMVAAPILEYSPLLNDDDLREIIAAGASSAALSAIARRAVVSEGVSEDIAATLDIPAIAALLTNQNAQIREATLDQIIDQAKGVEALHQPLAMRPQLSIRAMKRIAGFVASALVHAMVDGSALTEADAEDLLDRVRERLAGERVGEDEEAKLYKTALDLYERSAINDQFVHQQIESGRRELLIQCLALASDLPVATIRRIIHSKSGRAVTALAWRAQLSMRTAYELQVKFALVPSAQLLHPKDGRNYPIDADELDWHLSYFLDQP